MKTIEKMWKEFQESGLDQDETSRRDAFFAGAYGVAAALQNGNAELEHLYGEGVIFVLNKMIGRE